MAKFCFFIVVVTLLLSIKCTKLCSARNVFDSHTDQYALVAFKNSIIPDSYGIFLAKNWSIDTSVCYWIGVSCGVKHQRVTSLNLSGGQSFLQNNALCGASRFNVPSCGHIHTRSRAMNVSTLFLRYILPPIISVIILVIIIIVLIRRRRQHKKVQELVRGTSAFSETNLIGIGGFGSVFKGTLSDGLNVAIKVFNLELEGAYKSFDTESEILSSVRHRNLIRIIGCCCNTEFRALILAYMPNGSLEKWLYSESYFLDVLQRLNISLDVALALEYLHHGHTFPVVHCDIKPSNVLLDEDMTAHVSDFGISKLFDDGEVVIQTKTLATIGYAAPEYGSEGKVSTNGDVYSYGILLLEMFTGKRPTDDMFSGEMSLRDWVSEAILQETAVNELVAPGLLITEDRYLSVQEECVLSVFGLAMKCLALSPEERIDAMQIVSALQNIKTRFLASYRNLSIHGGYRKTSQQILI